MEEISPPVIESRYREIPGMFEGPVIPLTVKIGMPMLIGGMVQFSYALVDTYFISRIDPSSTAILAGTGLMFPLFFLFMAMSQSIAIGVASLVGRAIGQGNRAIAPHIIPSGLLIALCISLVAAVVSTSFSDRLVRLFAGAALSEEAIAYGLQFYRWLLPGLLTMLFAHTFAGILQGEGRTKRIMAAMVSSTILNIALDPLLIFGFGMGVAGAGLATSLSVLVAAVVLTVSFLRESASFPFSLNPMKVRLKLSGEIIRIGLPNFLSMASIAISFIIFNKLVSTIGEKEMNAWTIVGRMDHLVLLPSFAVAGAVVSMVAQNYGRGLHSRVRVIYTKSLLLAMSLVGGVALVYMVSAPIFFRFFSSVPAVVEQATLQVQLLSLSFIGISAAIVSSSTFQALGKPLPALMLVFIRMGVISIPVVLLLVHWFHLGIWGVYVGLLAGNIASLPLSYFAVRHFLRRV